MKINIKEFFSISIKSDVKARVFNRRDDILLIYAPFWVGIFYLLAITLFPAYDKFIFVLYLCFLGESHFACTWLFFINKENRDYILSRKTIFVYLPFFIVVAYLFLFLYNSYLAILVAGAASGIHVTRQSIGVSRLTGMQKNSFSETLIYLFSFGSIFFGFLRFYYFDGYLEDRIFYLIGLILTIILFLNILLFFRKASINQIASIVCGCVLYMPYFFVSEPYHAIAIGVGMHWCQYLALNYKVYKNSNFKFNKNFQFIVLFVFIYAFLMTYIETLGFKQVNIREGTLILILPLFGQILHYYYDAFIWRFSDPHIRSTIASKLFK